MLSSLSPYRDLWTRYLQPRLRQIVALSLVLLGDIGLQLLGPQVLRSFVDTVSTERSSSNLATLALVFLLVVCGAQLISILATYLSQNLGWAATNHLREDLMRHCLSLGLDFHEQHTPGEMIERIDGDTSLLANFFSIFVLRIVGSILLLMGILLLTWQAQWLIGVALVIYTLGALALLYRFRSLAVRPFGQFRAAAADLSGFWEERLTGKEDIAACDAAAYVVREQTLRLRLLMQHHRLATVMGRIFQAIMELLTALGSVLAFTLGAYLLSRGTITIGTVFLVFTYTTLLTKNLGDVTTQLNDLQGATSALERIRTLYAASPTVQDGPGMPLPLRPLGLAFEQVTFGYDPHRPVIHAVTLSLAAGHILGIVGRTGSGKTTLARLLMRFYDPSAGCVRLGGVDIRHLHRADLRQRMGMVTQTVQIFNASVRDNLALFNDQISDAQLHSAIEALGLGAWLSLLPAGLDTTVSAERLSGGEAQLLALIRIFLQDPDVVILDEAASRLDPATERLIDTALSRLFHGRTGVIIAHRPTSLTRVDEIAVLENGCLVEYGPREQLLVSSHSRLAIVHALRLAGEPP